jgi:hypothetical protein
VTHFGVSRAHERDVADVKYQAARWKSARRINAGVFAAVCEALDQGRCPQAVMVALVDGAFVKRGKLAPTDPVATFLGTLHNQEQRIIAWALGHVEDQRQDEVAP